MLAEYSLCYFFTHPVNVVVFGSILAGKGTARLQFKRRQRLIAEGTLVEAPKVLRGWGVGGDIPLPASGGA